MIILNKYYFKNPEMLIMQERCVLIIPGKAMIDYSRH